MGSRYSAVVIMAPGDPMVGRSSPICPTPLRKSKLRVPGNLNERSFPNKPSNNVAEATKYITRVTRELTSGVRLSF